MVGENNFRNTRTINPTAISKYCHPLFIDATSHGGSPSFLAGQEYPGITIMPTMADNTEPKEKKTDRAVTKYCFPRGICSNNNVPSVGIDPFVD